MFVFDPTETCREGSIKRVPISTVNYIRVFVPAAITLSFSAMAYTDSEQIKVLVQTRLNPNNRL